MFAAFTTAAHFCVSAAMNVERFSGEPTSDLALSLARIAPISLVFIIAFISVLSLLTMDVGVPAGARMADQYVAFNFGHPLSTVVGTFWGCGGWRDVRELGARGLIGHCERPQFSRFNMWKHKTNVFEVHLDLPGQQIRDRPGRALVRDVNNVDTCHQLEHLA